MFKALFNWIMRTPHKKAEAVFVEVHDEQAIPARSSQAEPTGLVPFDEYLLERSRTQWQFGDWPSLARLDLDTLRHHPDRAKLALLAASAHQQNNDMAKARQFLRMAQDWGCSKAHLTRILLADAHNTLGRAAAINRQEARALSHFSSSVGIGMPGSDVKLTAQARAAHQFSQLGQQIGQGNLPPAIGSGAAFRLENGESVASQISSANAIALQRNSELVEVIEKQAQELKALKRNVQDTLKKEVMNATRQLEAYMGLQNYLRNGQVMPELHGWPVSPDFALLLIQLIEQNDYDLVVEFGSGSSTLLIAEALARSAAKTGRTAPARQIAFEHLEQYHQQTLAKLTEAGRGSVVQLELAPLVDYAAPDGVSYPYYGCQKTLARLAAEIGKADLKILVLVDGPPASTGKHARYPALPVVLAAFREADLDFLLDDYVREDEKEVVQKWVGHLDLGQERYSLVEKKMEKDACLLQVTKARAEA